MTAIIPPGETASVLFVGNSFTFYNDLPGCFASLAEVNGRTVEVGMAAKGGESLAGHAERAETLAAIAERDWDVVVLQGHSAEPIVDPEGMIGGARSLAARTGSARLVAYLTWAYRDRATLAAKLDRHGGSMGLDGAGADVLGRMQQILNDGYGEMAAAVDAVIAPAGPAWQATRAAHPGWVLFTDDGFHPTELGTWLTAVVFHRCLFGELPVAAPGDVELTGAPLAGPVFAALGEAAAAACGGA